MSERQAIGARAEQLIAERLVREGFVVLAQNARVGRLEIDVIARRGKLVVFCEVRARSNDLFMSPAESIDRRKQARIRRAAAAWLAGAKLGPVDVRFDAASVVFDAPEPRVEYYENAF